MTRPHMAWAILGWGLVSLLLVGLNSPVVIRAPVAGLFLVVGVGAAAAVALPDVRGFGRFAVVVIGGLGSWLINASIAVYAGTLSEWSSAGLLALSFGQAAILCAIALIRAQQTRARQ